MKYLSVSVFVLATMVLVGSSALGQTSAQERAANLRSQLSELETKQAELQTRLQGLEEKLKPESIEQSLAGVGSTRPEELREQRRRQLEIERNGVRTQLDLLAASRTRLEASIARADAEAYRQSAAPPVVTPQGASSETSPGSTVVDADARPAPRRRVRKKRTRRARRTHHIQTSPVVPRALSADYADNLTVRTKDQFARLGNSDFLIVLHNLRNLRNLRKVFLILNWQRLREVARAVTEF